MLEWGKDNFLWKASFVCNWGGYYLLLIRIPPVNRSFSLHLEVMKPIHKSPFCPISLTTCHFNLGELLVLTLLVPAGWSVYILYFSQSTCSIKHWGCLQEQSCTRSSVSLTSFWVPGSPKFVYDFPLANEGRWEGLRVVRGYLGMTRKVVSFPSFRSTGMP